MSSVIRNLIEYSNNNVDCIPLDVDSFKQINVDNQVCIPVQKPNIEQIVKVTSSAEITNTRVIKTPKGTSLEGVTLTGHKLIVEGVITQKVQYVADVSVQSIHTVHFDTNFITYIVLPEWFNPCSFVIASAFIEDVVAHQENCRCIYLNNTLLITADIC